MSAVEHDSTLDLLADVAADFAAPDPARARAGRDAGGRLDREMWGRIAANGWLGIAVPEEAGGAGLGPRAVAIVARRLGYAAFPEPFVAAGVFAPQLLAAAPSGSSGAGASAELLGRALAGEAVLAVAWQGTAGGLGSEAVGVTAADGRLDGAARFLGLADADHFLVAARAGTSAAVASEGDGVAIHLVAAGADGLTATEERRADGTADLRLDFAGVVAGEPLIDASAGAAALAEALESARLALAAELVGLTERVIELTLEYLSQRKQFGKPIGVQQALQHRVVDAWIQGRLAAAALEAAVAVHECEADAAARAAASSSAKARAAAAAREVCNEALQLHGAIGFTDEYELGVYINRALSLAPWLGGAGEHRRRYAELVPIGPGEGR